MVVTYLQVTTYPSQDPNLYMHKTLQLSLSAENYQEAHVGELKRSIKGDKGPITMSSISTPCDDDGEDMVIDGMNDAGRLSMGHIVGIVCGMLDSFLLGNVFIAGE